MLSCHRYRRQPLSLFRDLARGGSAIPRWRGITLTIGAAVIATAAATVTITLHAASPPPARTQAGRPSSTAIPRTHSQAGSPSPASTAPQPGGAGQPAPSVPDPDLSDLRWMSYRGYSMPVSAQAGPRVIAGGLAYGFADTPAGALLAAANIASRTSWQFGPGVFGPTIERQVIGPYAMALLQVTQAAYSQDASQLPEISAYTRFVGYAIVSYTPSDAMLTLVQGATG